MKDTDADTDNAFEMQVLKAMNEESDEIIKATDRNKDESPEDLIEGYHIWNCNGLPIGVRIHKKRS